MKEYLEGDEGPLLGLTEGPVAKLGTLADEEFRPLGLYPDFDI